MKTINRFMIVLAAAAGISACQKAENPAPSPDPVQKSLTLNARLYFVSDQDPYISYKIYKIDKDSTKTEITSKATKIKSEDFDTLSLDKYIWESSMLFPDYRDSLYAMVFEDTLSTTGNYGYEVEFTKVSGQSVTESVKDLYGWSIQTKSKSGLDMSPKQNNRVGDFGDDAALDSEIGYMNTHAKDCRFEVREQK